LAQQATIAKLPVRYVWTTVLMVVIGKNLVNERSGEDEQFMGR